MNELLVVSFIFLNIFSSYPTSFNLVSRSFKTIIRLSKYFNNFFCQASKIYCVSIQDSLFFGKALELWFLWCQMAIHIIPSACCFIFHVLWSVHRKWLKALTRMSIPFILTSTGCAKRILTRIRSAFSIYGGVFMVIFTLSTDSRGHLIWPAGVWIDNSSRFGGYLG